MSIQLNKQEKALYFLSAFSVILSIGRVMYSGHLNYLFLAWNLFLAWIPYLISKYGINENNKWSLRNLCFIGAWLAFLPNAPYLVTDFVHLNTTGTLKWLDIVILSSYAISGLLLFHLSILQFRHKFLQDYSKGIKQFVLIMLSGISGYGIYLGRDLRYNSWEVITNPLGLVRSIFNSVFDPANFKHTLYITSLFMLFLYISIMVFDHLLNTSEEKNSMNKLRE